MNPSRPAAHSAVVTTSLQDPEKLEGYDEKIERKDDDMLQEDGSNVQHGNRKKTDPVEIRLVRKLDWIMLPMLCLMYWLNYLDRNAIAVARLDNMEKELNLTSTQYVSSVSILFVGYILGQVPSNMLITRVRPSYFMAGAMALWAVVSTVTGLVKDFKGLLLTRFFLGITEAPFYPGALYMVAMFYTKQELATRMAILYSSGILATATAGLIAIGIFEMGGIAGLSGWRWLFIIQGIVTFIVAVLSAWVLPDEPLNTRWLSDEERKLAHSRVVSETVRLKSNTSTWVGLKEVLLDPRMWILIPMHHFHFAAAGFKNFFPTIVETLGFGRNVTFALVCPPYIIAGASSILWAASSGRLNDRVWHITIAKTIAIIGFVVACSSLNTGARYFAMCIFATGVYACNSVIQSWISTTCGQTREKKAIALALTNTVANLSPIYTPYLWPTSDEPRYMTAMLSSAVFSGISVVLAWVLRWMLIRENRKIVETSGANAAQFIY